MRYARGKERKKPYNNKRWHRTARGRLGRLAITNHHHYNEGTMSAQQLNISSPHSSTATENSTVNIVAGASQIQTPSTSSGRNNTALRSSAPGRRETKASSSIKDASLREYVEQGEISQDFLKKYDGLVGALARVENDVATGNIDNVRNALNDIQDHLGNTSLTLDSFVHGAELCENNGQDWRTLMLNYCASLHPKAQETRAISECIFNASKKLKSLIESDEEKKKIAKNFGYSLINDMVDRLREVKGDDESNAKNFAYALNWVAFSCIDNEEYDDAVDYADEGIKVMDKRFKMKDSPKFQTYTRLLLNRGVAYYHLGNAKEAAINLKRASKTITIATDFQRGQKSTLQALIRHHRNRNNALCASSN